jgi:hypothetical protein
MASQGITGIGGHRQNMALVEQLYRLLEQTYLWVVRMNIEKLSHERKALLRSE